MDYREKRLTYSIEGRASRIRERVTIKDTGSSEYRGSLSYKKIMRHLNRYMLWFHAGSRALFLVKGVEGYFNLGHCKIITLRGS